MWAYLVLGGRVVGPSGEEAATCAAHCTASTGGLALLLEDPEGRRRQALLGEARGGRTLLLQPEQRGKEGEGSLAEGRRKDRGKCGVVEPNQASRRLWRMSVADERDSEKFVRTCCCQ